MLCQRQVRSDILISDGSAEGPLGKATHYLGGILIGLAIHVLVRLRRPLLVVRAGLNNAVDDNARSVHFLQTSISNFATIVLFAPRQFTEASKLNFGSTISSKSRRPVAVTKPHLNTPTFRSQRRFLMVTRRLSGRSQRGPVYVGASVSATCCSGAVTYTSKRCKSWRNTPDNRYAFVHAIPWRDARPLIPQRR